MSMPTIRRSRGRHRLELPVRPRRLRRALGLVAIGALTAAGAYATNSDAHAAPEEWSGSNIQGGTTR